MGAKEQAVLGDLDRFSDQANPHDLTGVPVAHTVGGPSETHRARGVDRSQDFITLGWSCGPGGFGSSVHPIVIFCQMSAGVGSDKDPVVVNVQQPVDRLNGHGLAGQVAPDVVAVFEDAYAPSPVHPPAHDGRLRLGSLLGLGIRIEDLGG